METVKKNIKGSNFSQIKNFYTIKCVILKLKANDKVGENSRIFDKCLITERHKKLLQIKIIQKKKNEEKIWIKYRKKEMEMVLKY